MGDAETTLNVVNREDKFYLCSILDPANTVLWTKISLVFHLIHRRELPERCERGRNVSFSKSTVSKRAFVSRHSTVLASDSHITCFAGYTSTAWRQVLAIPVPHTFGRRAPRRHARTVSVALAESVNLPNSCGMRPGHNKEKNQLRMLFRKRFWVQL